MDYKPKIKLSQDEFRVLASDTRIEILKHLDESQLTVSDLSRKLDMNKATVHEHLAKLMGVGLVKKDDSPRKWVYYRLTWKGRNLLHPERVRVMVSLGIMLTVIVLGALLVAMNTDLIIRDDPDDPPIVPMETTVHLYWAEEMAVPDTYDINIKASTAVTITEVRDVKTYIEDEPTSITRRDPIALTWAWGTDVIHIYDYDDLLEEQEGKYLFVEGTLLDNRVTERPFSLHRYITPKGLEIDLRISALGIIINTTQMEEKDTVTITFEVENVGSVNVSATIVEVFSVMPTFRASGYPAYGSPYLKEIYNTSIGVPINASVEVSFEKMASELYMRGLLVVVDPNNEMPEVPTDNNLVTTDVPEEVRILNEKLQEKPPDASDEGALAVSGGIIGLAMIATMIILIAVAVMILRKK